MSLFEKARRGLIKVEAQLGLESHKELHNAISEEEDVIKSIEELVRQREESTKYHTKWRRTETDPGMLAALDNMAEASPMHSEAFKALAAGHKAYIATLKEILKKEEELTKNVEMVKKLEGQLKAGKTTEGQVKGAREERDKLMAETHEHTAKAHHDALVALCQAHVDAYKQSLTLFEKQLSFLQSDQCQGQVGGDAVDLPDDVVVPGEAAAGDA